jgi:hypothetical protein
MKNKFTLLLKITGVVIAVDILIGLSILAFSIMYFN